jgi:DNA-binding FadR family transcriptional regulator
MADGPYSTQEAVDLVGQKIIAGSVGYRPGDVLSTDTVAERQGFSKPMAREVLQSLHHLKLIRIQPRHGGVVQPLPQWDMLNPTVIRWRLADRAYSKRTQRSLTELRNVIEPEAARLAAERAPAETCYRLMNLADELADLGLDGNFADAGQRQRFRDLDADFHTTLLAASDNEAFRSLAHPVVEAMNHRIDRQWAGSAGPGAQRAAGEVREFPERPERIAMWFHRCLARAVSQGLPDTAVAFARALLAEIDGELLTNEGLRSSVRRGVADLGLPEEQQQEIGAELDAALRAARRRLAGRGR